MLQIGSVLICEGQSGSGYEESGAQSLGSSTILKQRPVGLTSAVPSVNWMMEDILGPAPANSNHLFSDIITTRTIMETSNNRQNTYPQNTLYVGKMQAKCEAMHNYHSDSMPGL